MTSDCVNQKDDMTEMREKTDDSAKNKQKDEQARGRKNEAVWVEKRIKKTEVQNDGK